MPANPTEARDLIKSTEYAMKDNPYVAANNPYVADNKTNSKNLFGDFKKSYVFDQTFSPD